MKNCTLRKTDGIPILKSHQSGNNTIAFLSTVVLGADGKISLHFMTE